MKLNKTVTGYIERKEIEELIQKEVGFKIERFSFEFDKDNNIIGASFDVDETVPLGIMTREVDEFDRGGDKVFKVDTVSNKETKCPAIPDKYEILFETRSDDPSVIRSIIKNINMNSKLREIVKNVKD